MHPDALPLAAATHSAGWRSSQPIAAMTMLKPTLKRGATLKQKAAEAAAG